MAGCCTGSVRSARRRGTPADHGDTRARLRMTVVSSFGAHDLDPERLSSGGPRLRDLLALAGGQPGPDDGDGPASGASTAPQDAPDLLLADLAARLRSVGFPARGRQGAGDAPSGLGRRRGRPGPGRPGGGHAARRPATRLRAEGLRVVERYGASASVIDLAVGQDGGPLLVAVEVRRPGIRRDHQHPRARPVAGRAAAATGVDAPGPGRRTCSGTRRERWRGWCPWCGRRPRASASGWPARCVPRRWPTGRASGGTVTGRLWRPPRSRSCCPDRAPGCPPAWTSTRTPPSSSTRWWLDPRGRPRPHRRAGRRAGEAAPGFGRRGARVDAALDAAIARVAGAVSEGRGERRPAGARTSRRGAG